MHALHLNNPKCCSSDRLTAGTCICSGAIRKMTGCIDNDKGNDSDNDDDDYTGNDHSSNNRDTDGNNNNNDNAFQLMIC